MHVLAVVNSSLVHKINSETGRAHFCVWSGVMYMKDKDLILGHDKGREWIWSLGLDGGGCRQSY